MSLDVLDGVADASVWRQTLEILPPEAQDIYMEADYALLQAASPDVRALLFRYTRESAIWIQPIILRAIKHVGQQSLDKAWSDLETPYGYGGPYATTGDPVFHADAHAAFSDWSREHGVVTEFVRFHPLLENHQNCPSNVLITEDRETASINLGLIDDDLFCFNQKSRNMIRRAIKEGVGIEAIDPATGFDRFVDLYRRTMERLGAGGYYLFDPLYFQRLAKLVGQSGFLLAAVKDGRWLAAAVFIRGKRFLHYHLGANEAENRVPGAANLIIAQAAKLGGEEGLLRLHLGGGRTRSKEDALWRFKLSMCTDTHCFRTGRRVHNAIVYSELRDRWLLQFPNEARLVEQRLQFYREKMQ